MISRRTFLKSFGAMVVAGLGFGGYAFGLEPVLRMNVTRYRLTPPRWPADFKLRVAVLADVHACDPWMTLQRVEEIVCATNALKPDIVLLLGDYVSGMRFVTKYVPSSQWAAAMGALHAPLGTHAVLGNHDWWEDKAAQKRKSGPTVAGKALKEAGIPVYENQAVRLEKDGNPFWLAGLGDQLAFVERTKMGRRRFRGVDDLPGTLAKISDDAPVILLA
ncbi:MAG: metallophosphoesterase, partial [Pseudomonadota bacterium]